MIPNDPRAQALAEIIAANTPEHLRPYALRLAGKESGFNPAAVSPTGAAGTFQFTRGTGKQYGLVGPGFDRRTDPVANTQAFVRFTEDNKAELTKALGREPTFGELALAHQQGAQGAISLLRGGTVPAENLRVNNVDPALGGTAAAQKIMAYYDMPGGGPAAGGPVRPVAEGGSGPTGGPAASAGSQPAPDTAKLANVLLGVGTGGSAGPELPFAPKEAPMPAPRPFTPATPPPVQGGPAAISPTVAEGSGGVQTVSTSVAPSPGDVARQQQMADALLARSQGSGVIQHPLQGVNQMAQAGLGGFLRYRASQDEKALADARAKALAGALDPTAAGMTREQFQELARTNPRAAEAIAQSVITKRLTPQEKWEAVTLADGSQAQRSSVTGETRVLTQPKAPYVVPEGSRLVDLSGKELAPAKPKTFRNLITPEERSAAGIPPEDKRPYQIDPDGKLVTPPGGTNVNIDQKAESSVRASGGAALGKGYAELVEGGRNASEAISTIKTLGAILGNIGTGKMAEAKAMIGPYAEALGIKVDGLSEIQAAESIINRVAPSLRVPGSGAQSDMELRNFMKSLPTLGNTPEGNAVIQRTLEALYQHRVQAAEIASQVLAGKLEPAQGDKLIRDLPDPMAGYRESISKKGGAPAGQAASATPSQPAAQPAPVQPQAGAPDKMAPLVGPGVPVREMPVPKAAPDAPPPGIDPKLWQFVDPKDRALWQN